MVEDKTKTLRQVRGLTLTLAIYFTVSTLAFIFSTIGVLTIKLIDFKDLGLDSNEIEMMKESITTFDMVVIVTNLIVALIVCIYMYRFKSKLQQGYLVSKSPYIGIVILQTFNICHQMISGEFILKSFVLNMGVMILAGLVINKLSKLAAEFDADEVVLEL